MSLLSYLPTYYKSIAEMKALLDREDEVFDLVRQAIEDFPSKNAVLECDETEITLWENFLCLNHVGTLAQRRIAVVACLRGQGQLNEEKIKEIVNSFTGNVDSALVDFTNSVLRVRIMPPQWGEIYNFTEIEKTLRPRVPSHITLTVERFYHTWQDIASSNSNWLAVKENYESWESVKMKV